jgi:hypothetical protein
MADPETDNASHQGGCACGDIRYRVHGGPLFVHACHCSWCQRETGGPFAINALIETDRIKVTGVAPDPVLTPSASGEGQKILRCPTCRVAVWSHYAMAVGDRIAFLRVGTLDAPAAMPPDIHIFTSTKLPWLILPPGVPAVPEYYRRREIWPAESLARFDALSDAA